MGKTPAFCDEGRVVGTFFVGSGLMAILSLKRGAPLGLMLKPRFDRPPTSGFIPRYATAIANALRVRCLSLAPSVLLPFIWSWWLGRARLSGSAFSFSVAEWLGQSPRLVGELLLLSGRVDTPGGRTARRTKVRAGAPPFYGSKPGSLNEQTYLSPFVWCSCIFGTSSPDQKREYPYDKSLVSRRGYYHKFIFSWSVRWSDENASFL